MKETTIDLPEIDFKDVGRKVGERFADFADHFGSRLAASLEITTATLCAYRVVINTIGSIDDVHAGIVENLFAADLAFLQDLYRRVNTEGHTRASVTCPACSHRFAVDVSGGRLGES